MPSQLPSPEELRRELKSLVVESARLGNSPDEIADDEPLFGGRFGLDSLDALQLAVAIDERWQITIPEDVEGRKAFASIAKLADFLRASAG